jgi:Predicted metal-dependent enzyme
MLGLVDSLKVGMSALMYSAEFFDENPNETKTQEKESLFNRIFKEKADDVAMSLTVFLSIAIAVIVFMILPNFLTNLFVNRIESSILLNLIEGFIRIFIFFLYVVWVSKLEDVRRVFEYHGAEHKKHTCLRKMEYH